MPACGKTGKNIDSNMECPKIKKVDSLIKTGDYIYFSDTPYK